jgi:hypothetical protein
VCGIHALDFTRKPDDYVLIHCFGCGGGLDEVHAATEIRKPRLLTWPPPDELGAAVPCHGHRESRRKPPPLPSIGTVDGWASALLSSGPPLDYLVKYRQLHADVLSEYRVGWDSALGDLTFPAFDRGELVQLYRRKPRDGAKMRAAPGRSRPPYPNLPPGRDAWLVAGELDALTGRQLGLHAVTVSGCTLPFAVAPRFAGRVVYVMFDVGEEIAQISVVGKLEDVAVRVYDVRLAELGLPPKADLNDAYRTSIRRPELDRLMRDARARRSS